MLIFSIQSRRRAIATGDNLYSPDLHGTTRRVTYACVDLVESVGSIPDPSLD